MWLGAGGSSAGAMWLIAPMWSYLALQVRHWGVLPNPAVLESLGLQMIPVEEGGDFLTGGSEQNAWGG